MTRIKITEDEMAGRKSIHKRNDALYITYEFSDKEIQQILSDYQTVELLLTQYKLVVRALNERDREQSASPLILFKNMIEKAIPKQILEGDKK